jgi:hypothetical protein
LTGPVVGLKPRVFPAIVEAWLKMLPVWEDVDWASDAKLVVELTEGILDR